LKKNDEESQDKRSVSVESSDRNHNRSTVQKVKKSKSPIPIFDHLMKKDSFEEYESSRSYVQSTKPMRLTDLDKKQQKLSDLKESTSDRDEKGEMDDLPTVDSDPTTNESNKTTKSTHSISNQPKVESDDSFLGETENSQGKSNEEEEVEDTTRQITLAELEKQVESANKVERKDDKKITPTTTANNDEEAEQINREINQNYKKILNPDDAAIKIQSTFRGYKTRSTMNKVNNSSNK
jgi:hypothetical protein